MYMNRQMRQMQSEVRREAERGKGTHKHERDLAWPQDVESRGVVELRIEIVDQFVQFFHFLKKNSAQSKKGPKIRKQLYSRYVRVRRAHLLVVRSREELRQLKAEES